MLNRPENSMPHILFILRYIIDYAIVQFISNEHPAETPPWPITAKLPAPAPGLTN